MAEHYRHVQPGHLMRIVLLVSMLLVGFVPSVVPARGQPVPAILAGVVLCVMLLSLVLFHSLTVVVDDQALRVWFGPGLIRKTIALREIESCRAVRNPWIYGLGIHLTREGWVYNVSGFGAVEVVLVNGRKYRIGSDEPAELAAAIQNALKTREQV